MDIFCFLMGILYLYTHHVLLPLALLFIYFIKPKVSLLLFFALGMCLAGIHAWWIEPQGLSTQSIITKAIITGQVASIPHRQWNKTQFHFAVESFNGHPASALIQLAWYQNAPSLHVGEHWQFTVKLKKPHNFYNPGSKDYETSLRTKHIFWTGYILGKDQTQLPSTHTFSWLKLRESLAAQLLIQTQDLRLVGIIEALTLNLPHHISQEDWELFRRTGTIHLFGISGEHIALLSGLFYWVIRKLWAKKNSWCLHIPAQSVGSLGGLCIAIFYAFLAGFEPPVQRALIGCALYSLMMLGTQKLTPWQIWRYALLGVLCIEPHAVFMQGFYFSFCAVACIFLTQQRFQLKGYPNTLALQLSCLIGLMPLTLYWFSYGSLNGFLANLIAIPFVGFLLVPLSLLCLFLGNLTGIWWLLKPVSCLVALLYQGLKWTEYLASINIQWALQSIDLTLCFMGALLIWVILPARPFHYIALLWFVLPFFPAITQINVGEALIQVLDVGQGLAVSVRTQDHALLYDTGDAFYQGSDLGQMVILPFYQALGLKKIDMVVISHPDKDHRGGLKSVQAGMPVGRLLVNDPKSYHQGINCHHYPAWKWDGVEFQFLPIEATFPDKNNNSCTLQIRTQGGKALFAGDIEKKGEEYLLGRYPDKLASDVLLVPHHGSKTSSTYRFLLDVAPKYALASLGLDNRFRFPHEKTLHNMQALHIPLFRTDQCGMIEVTLPAEGKMQRPQCYHQSILNKT